MLRRIFEHCTDTANLLSRVQGLDFPDETESIEAQGRREHSELVPDLVEEEEVRAAWTRNETQG